MEVAKIERQQQQPQNLHRRGRRGAQRKTKEITKSKVVVSRILQKQKLTTCMTLISTDRTSNGISVDQRKSVVRVGFVFQITAVRCDPGDSEAVLPLPKRVRSDINIKD